jgi:Zn-dependent protease with chaperone function
VLVFFMVKPLFARRAPRAQPLAMNPALEPTLYAFIARICDLVGAPMPRRIDLVCDLNAAAGFRRGAVSLLGNDLVLTIGLPLVSGLSLQQFAGIIAHEFGHFAQGFGMRLSYIIRRINGWFVRLVYERDAWDLWLEELGMEGQDAGTLIVVNFARLGVGASRLVLKLLMLLAHAVSCFLLRQMEYDADSYAIKVAGSGAMEAATRRDGGTGRSAWPELQGDAHDMEPEPQAAGGFPRLSGGTTCQASTSLLSADAG